MSSKYPLISHFLDDDMDDELSETDSKQGAFRGETDLLNFGLEDDIWSKWEKNNENTGTISKTKRGERSRARLQKRVDTLEAEMRETKALLLQLLNENPTQSVPPLNSPQSNPSSGNPPLPNPLSQFLPLLSPPLQNSPLQNSLLPNSSLHNQPSENLPMQKNPPQYPPGPQLIPVILWDHQAEGSSSDERQSSAELSRDSRNARCDRRIEEWKGSFSKETESPTLEDFLFNVMVFTNNNINNGLSDDCDNIPINFRNDLEPFTTTPETVGMEHRLADEERQELIEVGRNCPCRSEGNLRRTTQLQYELVLANPMYQNSPTIQAEITREIERHQKLDAVEGCLSEWTEPLVPVREENEELRACCNSSRISSTTKEPPDPIGDINDSVNYIPVIDLKYTYCQITWNEEFKYSQGAPKYVLVLVKRQIGEHYHELEDDTGKRLGAFNCKFLKKLNQTSSQHVK